MPLFGPKPLPLTSYGYQPPRGATARGWKCTNYDCGQAGQDEPMKRWPARCPACTWPADPLLDEPWAHEAEGTELSWEIAHHAERRGGYAQERLMAWRLKDALLRGDAADTQAARAALRDYASRKARECDWWIPSNVYWDVVTDALAAGDIGGAADDLCFWLGISSGDDAENDNRNRTNSRTVILAATRFFDTPGGRSHPRAPEIRQGCLRVAEGAFKSLFPDQQAAVMQMARE